MFLHYDHVHHHCQQYRVKDKTLRSIPIKMTSSRSPNVIGNVPTDLPLKRKRSISPDIGKRAIRRKADENKQPQLAQSSNVDQHTTQQETQRRPWPVVDQQQRTQGQIPPDSINQARSYLQQIVHLHPSGSRHHFGWEKSYVEGVMRVVLTAMGAFKSRDRC